MIPSPAKSIEVWFDVASNYSYLSVMRIEGAAARRGVAIAWRPFLLGPVFKAAGWSEPPFIQQRRKGEYMWQDMVRECRKAGIPWRRPSVFPRHSVLAMQVAYLAEAQPWMPAFARRVMARNFADDQDIATAQDLAPILDGLGVPGAETLARAQAADNRAGLRRRVEEAIDRGIFGGPTFFAGGEMFWGNDRLDDALDHAASAGVPAPAAGRG